MKKLTAVVIMALFAFGLTATAQPERQRGARGLEDRKEFIASLKLTDAQKKDMGNLKLDTEKKAIELRAAAATAKVELRHLLMADAPDQGAIEKKIAEVVKSESALRMNKLDAWFAANKMLTPEQQKVWIKALRAGAMREMNGRGAGKGRPMEHHMQ